MMQTSMQRSSHVTVWLALVVALFSTQCDSLSDDCRKTLTCGDAGAPVLSVQDCTWRLPDGGVWEDGPQRGPDGMWRWPDGQLTAEQEFQCLLPTPGQGEPSDNCTDGVEPAVAGRITCEAPSLCNVTTRNCVRCLGDEDCAAGGVAEGTGGLFCHPTQGICVDCLEHVDCGPGRYCDPHPMTAARNKCVECLRNVDCPIPEVCDEQTKACTLACTGDGDCREGKPRCDQESRVCVACLSDEHCSDGSQCHPQRHECVQCTGPGRCTAPLPICELEAGSCVQCVDDGHCGGSLPPRCSKETNTCVACLEHGHCTSPAASRCNTATNQCAPCTADPQCEGGAVCRTTDGVCVQCVSDEQCGAAGHCDVDAGRCVECLADADCPSADAPRCETSPTAAERFSCQPCTPQDGSSECAGKLPAVGPFCRPDGACGFCVTNAECTSNPAESRCLNGGCTQCLVDGDCDLFSNQRACRTSPSGNTCVQCTDANHCATPSNAGRPVCKIAVDSGTAPLNTCVECTTNADCGEPGASKCVANECVPCEVNSECSHIDGRGVCDAGECVECTGSNNAACAVGGAARVCNSLTRECTLFEPRSAFVCDSCVSDLQCQTSQLCVEQRFDNRPVGFFCFDRQPPAGCGTRPYTQSIAQASSVDRQASSICGLALTTCPALDDFTVATPCGTAASPDSSICGAPGFDDGVCLPVAGNAFCSIPCGGSALNCTGGACEQQVCSL